MAAAREDLSFATTDELIEELRRRFDASVFVGVQPTKVRARDEQAIDCRWNGSRTWCLGLLAHAVARLSPASIDTEPPRGDRG